MLQRKVEIIVGGFMLLGMAALAFLAIQVSGLNLSSAGRGSYQISASFNNVAGLTHRAQGLVAGVQVGHVTAIHIDPITVRAVVDMAIDEDVDYLTADSIASIKTAGVLGEQYVSIAPGAEPDILTDGGVIRDTQSALVLEDLIGKFMSSLGNSP
jgi:phospholipid/cholesterol/gamma-HCH transport system substrate-binding protein